MRSRGVHPAAAAKLTKALLRGAKWVGENPKAAAEMSVDSNYLASSKEINTQAISKLKYIPGVSKCRESVRSNRRGLSEECPRRPRAAPMDGCAEGIARNPREGRERFPRHLR